MRQVIAFRYSMKKFQDETLRHFNTVFRDRIVGYCGFVLLSIAVVFFGLRLDQANLRVPLMYQGDVLLILPLVKCTIETGTHWRNDRLGAPGIQELHDFPIVDHFHFAILWLLGQVLPNYVVVYNLYHIASYPLTVLTTMVVLRSFGVSFLSAGLAGMLYAFLPYHYIRGLGHYFLSAYWTLPLSLWPVLRLIWGLGLFEKRSTAAGTVLIAVMTACAGAYYAFFSCAVLAFVGLYTACSRRTGKPLASGCLVIAIIVSVGVLNHLPASLYQSQWGPNTEPTQRQPEEAEYYGLKLAQMLLPVHDHHWKFLSDIRAKYDSNHRPLQNENETATLGLIGSITVLILLVSVILPLEHGGRRPPEQSLREKAETENTYPALRGIASLVLFLILLGTVGGLGSLFNFFITPQVRSLNRISIVIAFFVFSAIAIVIDKLKYRRLACLGLIVFGIWDETNRYWFCLSNDSLPGKLNEWNHDARFFSEVEALDPQGMIFCLPYMTYPEGTRIGQMDGYDHCRGYLHSHSLRFSFGAMRNRETDNWQRDILTAPVSEMLDRLIYRGFTGLLIDDRGFPDDLDAGMYRQRIRESLGGSAAEQNDGSLHYLSLHEHKVRMLHELGEVEFCHRKDREWNRVSVLWLDGFVQFNPLGQENRHRQCSQHGTMVIVNPSNTTRTFKASMVIRSSTTRAGQLEIDGGEVWSETMPLTDSSASIERTWTVKPGRHTIRFRYEPSRDHVPGDSRNVMFFIASFTMDESNVSR